MARNADPLDMSAGFTGGHDNASVVLCLYGVDTHRGLGVDLYFSSVAEARAVLEKALAQFANVTQEDFAKYKQDRLDVEKQLSEEADCDAPTLVEEEG